MSDIVERLRVGICYQQCRVKDTASGCECAEAADEIEFLREGKKLVIWQYRDAAAEIERLRAALRVVLSDFGYTLPNGTKDMIRAALRDEE